MKVAFALPTTPTSKVIYTQRKFMGQPCTPYLTSALIATPKSNDELVCVMLSRQVGQSDIKGIEPVKPRQDLDRPHPASHRLVKYVALTSCLALACILCGCASAKPQHINFDRAETLSRIC